MRAEKPGDPEFSPVMQELLNEFPTYTLKDIQSFKINPANHIVGHGFLRKGAACLLTGGTGDGKSVLGAQFALGLASGKDILKIFKVHQPQRVLYIEAENDEEILKKDLFSILEHTQYPTPIIQKNLVIRHVPGLDGETFGEFLHACVKLHRPNVIIIDPYQSFVGAVDMNSSMSFLSWKSAIEFILYTYHVALLLIAHGPKPGSREDWSVRQGIYSQSGTKTLSNWVRTGFELVPLKNEMLKFRLEISKNAELIDLDQNPPHRALFIEHSGNPRTPYWKVSPVQEGAVHVDVKALVRACAKEHPDMSQRDMAVHLHLGKSTIAHHLRGWVRPTKVKGKKK